MSKHERTDDVASVAEDATPTIETRPPLGAPPAAEVSSAEPPSIEGSVAEPPSVEGSVAEPPSIEAPAEGSPTDASADATLSPDAPGDDAPKKKKNRDKQKQKKKKDSSAEVTKELKLTDEQKESIRLRAESRLKKEYERTVDARLRADLEVDEAELKSLKKKLVKAQGSPERGIETWFRLASRNLYTRRQIVDTKSNILITVNSIILSVVLGTMSREIADQPHLAIAIVPLVTANLFSMAFAIFATKPRVARGVFTPEELDDRRVSLMTFDDFYKMDAEDYEAAINRVLDDRSLLYGTIQRDIYSLGIDLSQRYMQIQRSYSVFLTGVVFATLLFGATSYYFA